MIRDWVVNHRIYFWSLLRHISVDENAKINTERLSYIRNYQSKLSTKIYIRLTDAVGRKDAGPNLPGQIIVLRSSFTGGFRNKHEIIQYDKKWESLWPPDLLIKFTSTPCWNDIPKCLLPGQKSNHHHILIARMFHLKWKKMMNLSTYSKIFGKYEALWILKNLWLLK